MVQLQAVFSDNKIIRRINFMKIYSVTVFKLGADSPTTFYFKNEEKAQVCYHTFRRADDIISFEDDNFPLDMLDDYAF